MITFPNHRGFAVSETAFLVHWERWFAKHGAGLSAVTDSIPLLARNGTYADQIDAGRVFSLDVMCRDLTPRNDTRQGDSVFVSANSHILTKSMAVNRSTHKAVDGAKLTAKAVKALAGITQQDRAEALASPEPVQVRPESSGITPALHHRACHGAPMVKLPPLIPSLVSALVDWIDRDPYQTYRRRVPVPPKIFGWTSRLACYSWPAPGGFLARVPALQVVGPWNPTQQASSVIFANQVFTWGKVNQKSPVTPQKVRHIFDSVRLGAAVANAPMNSGWTKVAAFASFGWAGVQEQVIWDSRVAHSLIRRLDCILVASGVNAIPNCLADIGTGRARGGTRIGAVYHLPWPDRYGSWVTQFAGSTLVRLMRDDLNNRKIGGRVWTLREVEMVLFMDGY